MMPSAGGMSVNDYIDDQLLHHDTILCCRLNGPVTRRNFHRAPTTHERLEPPLPSSHGKVISVRTPARFLFSVDAPNDATMSWSALIEHAIW